jgi:hypothetical protein
VHEQLNKTRTKPSKAADYALVVFGVVLAVASAILMGQMGMPQKWHAAGFGTIVPFGVVVSLLRSRWLRWSFWVSLLICLAIHLVAFWIFFEYVLLNIRHIATLTWAPVAFVETFALLVAVVKVEEKLSGKRERIMLS